MTTYILAVMLFSVFFFFSIFSKDNLEKFNNCACLRNLILSFFSWKHLQYFFSVLLHRRARVTFDTSETRKVFGPIVIDYHQVCIYLYKKLQYVYFTVTVLISVTTPKQECPLILQIQDFQILTRWF